MCRLFESEDDRKERRMNAFLEAADDDIGLVNYSIELTFQKIGRAPSISEVCETIKEKKDQWRAARTH